MVLISKDYHNEVIITSLQGVIKRPLEDNVRMSGYCDAQIDRCTFINCICITLPDNLKLLMENQLSLL